MGYVFWIVSAIAFICILIALLKWIIAKRIRVGLNNSQTCNSDIDITDRQDTPTNYGAIDGEYIVCSHGHKNHVGSPFDHPTLVCAECNELIKIRDNKKEFSEGAFMDELFRQYDEGVEWEKNCK